MRLDEYQELASHTAYGESLGSSPTGQTLEAYARSLEDEAIRVYSAASRRRIDVDSLARTLGETMRIVAVMACHLDLDLVEVAVDSIDRRTPIRVERAMGFRDSPQVEGRV